MAVERLRNRPCGGRYGDIVQSIGNTPLVELPRLSPKPGVRIWAKLESHNPTGSVKDRVARALIEDAEAKGAIGPGQTILEPTSGNTGISLAMICSRKGYKLKVVMPENVTPERTQLLQMYGAEIVYSPGDQGSNGAVAMALEMAGEDSSYYMPYQYGNEANPGAHYNGTALEILEELDEVAAFVAGLGTGGTLMGNGRRLKEELGDSVKIVAAEPMQGEPVQGLRSLDDGFIPPIIDISLLDRKIFVTNRDAIIWTRKLLDEEALFAGVSTGAIASHRRAHRRRARRGQRRLRRRRRRLEVPLQRHLHAAGRRDREPRVHRLVVARAAPGAGGEAAMKISGSAARRGDRARARRTPATRSAALVAVAADGERAATRVYRASNVHASPMKFEIDPKELLELHNAIEDAGYELGAIYHSHVRTAPVPVADRHQLRGQLAGGRVDHRRARRRAPSRRCAPI